MENGKEEDVDRELESLVINVGAVETERRIKSVKEAIEAGETVNYFLRIFRACLCFASSSSKLESKRHIRANNRPYNAQFNYANNVIKTSKYSVLTFLPYNLFEQFQRLPNFYFLCLMLLQMINKISSLTPVTTIIPLISVLTLTATKDAYDDFQRHKSDSHVNKRRAKVVHQGGDHLVEEKWSHVRVGDIIRMENDQFVAADVMLLSSSEPNGLCFIETSELDGETNLKCRQCLVETANLGQDNIQLGNFDGEIICEPPNNKLNNFVGNLTWNDKQYSLSNDNLLLRGCVLRNTEWCYGVVVFAGQDTKLMQNSGKTKLKRTTIDKLLNYIIIWIVLFLISLCIFCSLAGLFWEVTSGKMFLSLVMPTEEPDNVIINAGLNFLSYGIVLNTLVPISLYVSVEIIRFVQSFFINWDEHMYCKQRKIFATANTTTLNEELGQIEYIFSDKTGTLTQNIMVFNQCSIAGKTYGEVLDPITGEPIEDTTKIHEKIDFSFNKDYEPEFTFYDVSLLKDVRANKKEVHTFFTLLAVCHTVMPDSRNGKLQYQAQSPDEAALVSAARNFGFVFKNRTPNTITVEVMGEQREYEVMCILDFNNVRKRMSVILRNRKTKSLQLFCKGADSVIYQRLSPGDEVVKARTLEHLSKFAGDGLRTLCLAVKDLDSKTFETWSIKHHEASVALENREEKLHEVYEEIERNMTLIGVTAVEDKLQEGVAQTIANLSMAQIKIWVLTGDMQETAINVGYSCQLLNDDMALMVVDGDSMEDVVKQLTKCQEIMQQGPLIQRPHHNSVVTFSYVSEMTAGEIERATGQEDKDKAEYALVIQGHSLVYALSQEVEQLFIAVTTQCKSVICCRATPLQKAVVVELVKKHKKAVTLAIGDGANDVSMIKAANIGVGISGHEGNQAMLASDYSIAQFRFLQRLLLVHGRWSYYRMAKFLRYFFYKNFAFTLCNFWFALFCGYSAQTVFDPVFISCYNLFFTSMPVLAIGVFDQDVDDNYSIQYPQLYIPGQLNMFFNKREFFLSALQGFYTSAILFLLPYWAYKASISVTGQVLSGYLTFSSALATLLVITVTIQVMFDTDYWTIFSHITIWGSLVMYFVVDFIQHTISTQSRVTSLLMVMMEPLFWLTTAVTVVTLIMPVIAWRFYFIDVFPTLIDKVRDKQRTLKRRPLRPTTRPITPSARKHRHSIRSGYAFAHQEGFGRLITSGKLIRRNAIRRNCDTNHVSPGSSLENEIF